MSWQHSSGLPQSKDVTGLQEMLRRARHHRLADDLARDLSGGGRHGMAGRIDGETLLVAVDGNRVLGLLEGNVNRQDLGPWALVVHPGAQAWVDHIVTDRSERSQGVGSQLLLAFCQLAADLGRIIVAVGTTARRRREALIAVLPELRTPVGWRGWESARVRGGLGESSPAGQA